MHGRARLRNLDIIPYMNHLTGYWSLLYQIPVGLIGLSFMVFVHELGHFLAAKWSGVKVHTFSIGFGKKIVRFKRGDTEYCLSVIPFGGYVAMAGENPDEGGYHEITVEVTRPGLKIRTRPGYWMAAVPEHMR